MARKARTGKQKAASRRNLEKARAARKSTGLPSMGNAADAKARAFKRKPKGSSAMNAGARAAQKSRKLKSGLT